MPFLIFLRIPRDFLVFFKGKSGLSDVQKMDHRIFSRTVVKSYERAIESLSPRLSIARSIM